MRHVARSIIYLLLSIIFFLIIGQYVLSPRFEFTEAGKFRGDSIYNPYKSIDPSKYTPANFHAHAALGFGFFNGKGTANEIWNTYSKIGYGFHAVSQYQHIDRTNDTARNYIPVYEHGYNLRKTHQLVINASHVAWQDYILPQTLENKQAILSTMAEDTSAVIVLNHPNLRGGYTSDELKYLRNYDCIELLNPAANSFSQWDSALSHGNHVYALGNDDLHDIHNNNQLGRFCNLIYAPGKHAKEAVNSLKQGTNIVMWLPQVTGESIKDKIQKLNHRDFSFKQMDVSHGQLSIIFSNKIKSVEIYGQSGNLDYFGKDLTSVHIPFTNDSTYMRCVFQTYDNIKYVLNPVFRYNRVLESRSAIASAFLKKMPGNQGLAIILFSCWIVFSFWFYARNILPLNKILPRKRLLRRI